MNKKQLLSSNKKSLGFTLIELLIVIAVLGVLAAVVLVAINPVEQLARGRDSGRHSSTSQLGHAMQQWFTAQGGAVAYPAATNTWQNTLTTAAEIPAVITAPPGPDCAAANIHTGTDLCYAATGGGTGFVIWTILESAQQSVRAGGGTACAAGTVPMAIYDSTLGREGTWCLAATAVPTAGLALR